MINQALLGIGFSFGFLGICLFIFVGIPLILEKRKRLLDKREDRVT